MHAICYFMYVHAFRLYLHLSRIHIILGVFKFHTKVRILFTIKFEDMNNFGTTKYSTVEMQLFSLFATYIYTLSILNGSLWDTKSVKTRLNLHNLKANDDLHVHYMSFTVNIQLATICIDINLVSVSFL